MRMPRTIVDFLVVALLMLSGTATRVSAETISSHGQLNKEDAGTTRSNPNGSPARVVKAPPPPPEPVVIVPVNPRQLPNQSPNESPNSSRRQRAPHSGH